MAPKYGLLSHAKSVAAAMTVARRHEGFCSHQMHAIRSSGANMSHASGGCAATRRASYGKISNAIPAHAAGPIPSPSHLTSRYMLAPVSAMPASTITL